MYALSMSILILCSVMVQDALSHFIEARVRKFHLEEMKQKLPKLQRIFSAYFIIYSIVAVLEMMLCFNFDFATLSQKYGTLIIIAFGIFLTLISSMSTKGASFKSENHEKKFDKFLKVKTVLVAMCIILFVVNLILL